MKHNYDEPTTQAAIDAACKATASSTYRPSFALLRLVENDTTDDWQKETPARLHLIKTALEMLPEPPPPVVDGKTPGQVCHESMYNTPEWKWLLAGDKAACESAASAVLAAFGSKTAQPAEIPWVKWNGGECPLKDEEVEWFELKLRRNNKLATSSTAGLRWNNIGIGLDIIAYRVLKWKDGFGPAVDWKSKFEEAVDGHQCTIMALESAQARAEKAEAELARIVSAAHEAGWNGVENSKDLAQFIKDIAIASFSTLLPIAGSGDVPAGCARVTGFYDGQWYAGIGPSEEDTHFADIRLPDSQAPAAESLKDTYQFDGSPEPAQLWTPKVGDVVQLRSGGPKMTVADFAITGLVICNYFDGSKLCSPYFPTENLTPA